MKTLLMVANVDWFFISHRLVIAQEAISKGWKVYVAAEDSGRGAEIAINGITFIDFKFSRSGTNPLDEIETLRNFRELYKEVKPDIVHHITLKPVIYGSLTAKLLNIKGVVNAVSGLGYNFTSGRQGLVAKVMIKMMRYGFKRDSVTVIFQNEDDQRELTYLGVVQPNNKVIRIKGSGVDLEKFKQTELPSFKRIKVLFPTRMLWDKGTKELHDATEILKDKFKDKVQFILAGMADEDNKAGVPASYLNEWQDGEYVKWIGYQKNMVETYNDSHIIVLPSYREGMPKTLIEACAVGRAIVTTDAIGCKECVDEGVNGLKVPVYNAKELAKALETLFENHEMIKQMGDASRKKAEAEFDVRSVVAKHMEIYEELNA